MTQSMLRLFLIFVFSSFIAQFLKSQNFQTKSVSIFKNGQSFFIKEGKVSPENGVWRLPEKEVPPALFGTLWFHLESSEIDFVKSFPDSIIQKKEQITTNLNDILMLNKGKKMTLHLNDDSVLVGVIEEFKYINDFGNPSKIQSILIFKTETEWVSLYPKEVKRVDFLEAPNFLKNFTERKIKNIVEIGFENKKSEQDLDLMYLRYGLDWAPEYLLELNSETSATLTLQAEVVNDGEDLEDVEMNLIVGVPNFKYAYRRGPLINLFKFEKRAKANQIDFRSNTVTPAGASYRVDKEFSGNLNPNPTDGSPNEDLFFYTFENFSLPKGGRAMQQLFKEEIDIEHIYECNLETNQSQKNQFLFSIADKNKVLHSVKITNKTLQPWTTGAVLVMNQIGKTRPISQDELNYTSSKGHSFIKLTEAPDVKIKHSEKEVSREIRVKKIKETSHYWYDLVKVEGQIKIRNYKTKAIDLNIRRKINGILGESSVDWLKAEEVNRTLSLNKITNVCWETSLKADEELVVDYNYEIWVRN